jgi:choline dehydrogenase
MTADEICNQPKLKRAYDYIIIGSGASGAVIAGELSKTGAEVLVIESGGEDAGPTVTNPSVWFHNVGSPFDWALPIVPTPQLNNRHLNMALGRVLGGGSSVNAMVWTRGTARDYDGWERHGATGWSFQDVLPTFKAQEDWKGGANDWRGVGGPVHVRTPIDPHPSAPVFLEAARQMGFPIIEDMNGPMRPGAGYINMNIGVDGSRASSTRAFLRPNLGRTNLTLLLNTHATRVLFEGDRASGVEVVIGEVLQTVAAEREVIVAAGTIHSAKLLMLSGVGDAAELEKLGIARVANLRGVGKNLHDHILVAGVVFR